MDKTGHDHVWRFEKSEGGWDVYVCQICGDIKGQYEDTGGFE